MSDPRYAQLDVVGEGGMGQVQRFQDHLLERSVARKVMHPQIAADPAGQERFLREARIQGRLEHPAVVPVYDLGHDANGLPWFTMQEVRGETLQKVISALGSGDTEFEVRFSQRRLLTSFVQVCRAIDYAHSRKVLHRDLKPANIILGEFGDVHVLDWGLAVALGEVASGGGTAGYMAPEQILKKPLDQRCDVYALGAILFEVLAHRPMLEGNQDERRALAVGEARDRPPSSVAADPVPPELDAIVIGATRKDPTQRIQSARELANLVEQYLDGDRDREIQRARAARHLTTAAPLVDALETATTEDRERALLQVNSALALDPGNELALELMRKILTHVPATMPPEVEAAQLAAEEQNWASVSRTMSLRMANWMALVPLAWAMGPLSVPFAVSVVASVVLTFAVAWLLGRRPRLSQAGISMVLAISALPLIGASFIFGSFVLVPALASTGMVLAASHLRSRARAPVILIGVLVVLAPFGLSELGLIAPSYAFTGDEVHILPRLLHFPPVASKLLLVAATITTLMVPSLLAGQLKDRLALAERRLLLTAWHLQRLGKEPPTSPATKPAPRTGAAPRPPSPTAADTAL